MAVSDEIGAIAGFFQKSAVDKILILAWYSETALRKSHFDANAMRKLFLDVGVEPPDFSVYLRRLTEKRPPQLIRERGGYRLSSEVRRALSSEFGLSGTSVHVKKSLSDLPLQIPDIAEREFLAETIKCYTAGAFRAAVIMVWNLTVEHMYKWILDEQNRLRQFNDSILKKYPKKNISISVYDDFLEMKESEIIACLRSSGLVNKNIGQILGEKLIKRNRAAHPSSVIISQIQADEMIYDLITNVVVQYR